MQQMLFCVAIVSSVSPNWVSTTPSRLISSVVRLQAIAFASAVMDAVSSQEFIALSPQYQHMRLTPPVPAPGLHGAWWNCGTLIHLKASSKTRSLEMVWPNLHLHTAPGSNGQHILQIHPERIAAFFHQLQSMIPLRSAILPSCCQIPNI